MSDSEAGASASSAEDDGSDWEAESSGGDDDDDDDNESDADFSAEEEEEKPKAKAKAKGKGKAAAAAKGKAPPVSKAPANGAGSSKASAAAPASKKRPGPATAAKKAPSAKAPRAAPGAAGAASLPSKPSWQRPGLSSLGAAASSGPRKPQGLKARLQAAKGTSTTRAPRPLAPAAQAPAAPSSASLPSLGALPLPSLPSLPKLPPHATPATPNPLARAPAPHLPPRTPLTAFRPPGGANASGRTPLVTPGSLSGAPTGASASSSASAPPRSMGLSRRRPPGALQAPGRSPLGCAAAPAAGNLTSPALPVPPGTSLHQQGPAGASHDPGCAPGSRQFKSPLPNGGGSSQALRQRLAKTRMWRPWGGGPSSLQLPAIQRPVMPPTQPEELPEDDSKGGKPEDEGPPPEPLVLWEDPDGSGATVEVEQMLCRWLRPHQREGVKFVFECVCGLRNFDGHGCILADDMGLGKTLQGIALLWTLLQGGHEKLGGKPVAKRVIICCPTSLVNNWDSECEKWLKGKVRTLPLCESSREDVIRSLDMFLAPRHMHQVLIVSYETFRLHAGRFKAANSCDLLICDEAHRLKNDATLTNQALDSLACRRRVLLSGTPLQNHLDEFYAMVNFCNPGLLGTPHHFRKHYELPIVAGREPGAAEEEVSLGVERMAELNDLVGEFILRRTNSLLSQHLPPKVIQIVCCRPTELQLTLYRRYLESKSAAKLLEGKATKALEGVTALKKLCNHPKLIHDMLLSKPNTDGFEDCEPLFWPWLGETRRGGGRGTFAAGWENLGGKFAVLAKMLQLLRKDTDDRIVIVSNYTQTLDLVSTLCRERSYPFVRLDGSTSINKRQRLVQDFNNPACNQFVFLLSSKAGGCGLNLIGGNRLVLFDPDWNPANDKQAAGRVWRDGQRKRVFVYRFLTTGSIEEKVYQRQLSKEGLQSVVNNSSSGGGVGADGDGGDGDGESKKAPGSSSSSGKNLLSKEELRNLFQLRLETPSDTYDSLQRPPAKEKPKETAAKRGKKKSRGRRRMKRGAASGHLSSSSSSDDSGSDDRGGSGGEDGVFQAGAGRRKKAAQGGRSKRGGVRTPRDEDEGSCGVGNGTEEAAAAAPPEEEGEGEEKKDEAVAGTGPTYRLQVGEPAEEDLKRWGHHSSATTVPDKIMRCIGDEHVSFVFSCQVVGKQIEGEAVLSQPDATPDSPLLSQPKAAPPRHKQQQQQKEEERRPPPEAADAAAPREADTSDKNARVGSSGYAMRRAQNKKEEKGRVSSRAPRDSRKQSAGATVAGPRHSGGDCSSAGEDDDDEEGLMDEGGGRAALVEGSATPPESPCGVSSPSRLGCSEEENEDSDLEDGNYGRRGFFTSQAAAGGRGGGGGGGGAMPAPHLGSRAAPAAAARKAPEAALRGSPNTASAARRPLGSLSGNRPSEPPSGYGGPASSGTPAAPAQVCGPDPRSAVPPACADEGPKLPEKMPRSHQAGDTAPRHPEAAGRAGAEKKNIGAAAAAAAAGRRDRRVPIDDSSDDDFM